MESFSIRHNLISIYCYNHLPVHAEVLQSVISDDEPGQLLPPPDGGGLVHVLVLDFSPVPHVLVHDEYAPHTLHIPLTKKIISATVCGINFNSS